MFFFSDFICIDFSSFQIHKRFPVSFFLRTKERHESVDHDPAKQTVQLNECMEFWKCRRWSCFVGPRILGKQTWWSEASDGWVSLHISIVCVQIGRTMSLHVPRICCSLLARTRSMDPILFSTWWPVCKATCMMYSYSDVSLCSSVSDVISVFRGSSSQHERRRKRRIFMFRQCMSAFCDYVHSVYACPNRLHVWFNFLPCRQLFSLLFCITPCVTGCDWGFLKICPNLKCLKNCRSPYLHLH